MTLSADDLDIVRRALVAAADGPYFPDWEFHTLFGLGRAEVRGIAQEILDVRRADVRVAVGNALTNLLGYPHGRDGDIERELGVTIEALRAVQARWRAYAWADRRETCVVRVTVNGPRPPYYQVAYRLWGADADFDSDGNSLTPEDRNWTELTIVRRPDGDERVDVDPVSDTPLVFRVVGTTRALAMRAAVFLAESSDGVVDAENN